MQTVTHKSPNSIWLFDYTSLLDMDTCQELIVCLSERDLNIIWQAIKDIDRFRSRVYTDVNGDTYTKVSLEQFEEFQFWVSDLNVHLGDYSVCNELLERIAGALEGIQAMSGCCGGTVPGVNGGSGGAGMTPGAASGTTSTEDDRGGPPPEGFSSWGEFDGYQCRAAAYIIDQIIVDVATLSIVSIGLSDVAGLAALIVPLLTSPIGWAIILTIASMMVENLVIGLAYSLIITHLEDNKDEYICALLSGTDCASSINSFTDKIDELVDADSSFGGGLGQYLARRFIKAWATTDNINRMYTRQAVEYPDYPCPCGGEAIFEIFNPGGGGQGPYGDLSRDGDHYTGASEDVGGGTHRFNAHVVLSGTSTGRCLRLNNLAIAGATHTGNDDYYYPCGSTTPTICPSGNAINLEDECIHGLILASNSAFTIEFDVIACS